MRTIFVKCGVKCVIKIELVLFEIREERGGGGISAPPDYNGHQIARTR